MDERPSERPRRARRREATPRIIIGAVLVVLGLGIFLEQISGSDFSFVALLVGAGLLAGWTQSRNMALLIAGCIVSGIGVGSVLGTLVVPALRGPVESMSLAAGFAMINVLSRRRPTWPLIVAIILSAVAFFDLVDVAHLIPRSIARVGLPSVVVAAGVVLLARDRLPRGLARVLLVILTVAGITFATADGYDPPFGGPKSVLGPAATGTL